MDRREFLALMAKTGALAAMGGLNFSCSGSTTDPPESDQPQDSKVDYTARNPDGSLVPYLVIPKLGTYNQSDPTWTNWAGEPCPVPRPANGFLFDVPAVNQSVDIVVPVINFGTMTSRHLVLELYEFSSGKMITSLEECELRDRRGPFTLHPGIITGFPMTFTREYQWGATAVICYDPFHDPVHSISTVGVQSTERKNLGNCDGLIPPYYHEY